MPIENRDWYRKEWKKKHKEDDSFYCPEQERCPQCGKIFPNEDDLLHHAISEHRRKEVKKLPWYKRIFRKQG